jgi:hypothetical protein
MTAETLDSTELYALGSVSLKFYVTPTKKKTDTSSFCGNSTFKLSLF